MTTNYKTITLEKAKQAITAYNNGTYLGGVSNPTIDLQARSMFANGPGTTREKILEQVQFIGREYGGASGFKAAYSLAGDIAGDIFANRVQYDQTAKSALPILDQIANHRAIEILYRPFVKPLHGKSNWQVWGSKFWHFLNPRAFPIEDRFVNLFFQLNETNSVNLYLKFLGRFRDFALSHQDWLPHLRQMDGGLAWCDNKLWDKMCYGLGTLGELGSAARRC